MGYQVAQEQRLYEGAVRDGNPGAYFRELWEGLRSHQVRPYMIDSSGGIVPGPDYDSFRSDRLFEAFVHDGRGERIGRFAADGLRENRHNSIPGFGTNLTEAAINTSAFSSIIGQISYSATLDAFENPLFLASQLYSVQQAETLQQEIVPGISVLGDMAEAVGQGESYPEVGLTEEYITIPKKEKTGFQVSMTEEAAFEDKTGLLLQRANTGVQAMALAHEKDILDLVTGIITSYSRNGGAAQATYANTHQQGDFDNLSAANALVNWTNVEKSELMFDAITDPNTSESVMISASQILIPTALKYTANRILSATEIQHVDNQANADTVRTSSGNPIPSGFAMLSNSLVKNRSGSASTWFHGDFKRAFGYSEVWPVQTFTQDRNSGANFARDILFAIKWRRMGKGFVRDPRFVVKNTA